MSPEDVAAVRAFSRFYTGKLGVLDQHLLDSPFSLTEARVLYELAHSEKASARDIGGQLGLDAGYLSRILQGFETRGLVLRQPLPSDRRQYRLTLTAKGRQAFARLDRQSQRQIAELLEPLRDIDRDRLTGAMAEIEQLLGDSAGSQSPALLREPRPGDMGWVVQSHGALYAREYGFDASFEALVAEIVARFMTAFDASRERCWIAELAGKPVGSVFVVKANDETAKLRLLLVDPSTRGQGLGQRLVGECMGFARQRGYRRMTLWTQSILTSARSIYQQAGFQLVASEPHRSFSQDLVGETWEREL